MALFFGTWILVAVVLLVTQMRFYGAHQRAHNEWRARADQWVLARSGAEYWAMIRATFRRDPETEVERRRRQYLAMLVIAVAYLLIGFPVAVLGMGSP